MSKINIFGHFSSREHLKKNFDKILLDNNMTHLLKNKFSKDVGDRKKIKLSKASNSSFLNCSCTS